MGKIETFLSKAGSILRSGLQLVGIVLPVVTAVAPVSAQPTLQAAAGDLAQIGGTITLVEAVGQALALPGAQKLVAAAGPVASLIQQSSLMVGKQISNPALFQQGATKIADGMADVLNSLHQDGAKSVTA